MDRKDTMFQKLFHKGMSSKDFIGLIRSKGCKVGAHTHFFDPSSMIFDYDNAYLIQIGDYCKITAGVVLLAHDYAKSVSRRVFGSNIGGKAPLIIGDNCFIGMNSVLLMGTIIGDNCIIGAGSVVKGDFSEGNVVIAGNPARVICDLETYTARRKQKALKEALDCVKVIYENTGKLPSISQMGNGHAMLYLPRTNETVQKYPHFFSLTADEPDEVVKSFFASNPCFDSYEAFLDYACKELQIERHINRKP